MTWLTLEPENEEDGTRYAWKLVIEFDNDWQKWSLKNESGGLCVFSLHITDDMANEIQLEAK